MASFSHNFGIQNIFTVLCHGIVMILIIADAGPAEPASTHTPVMDIPMQLTPDDLDMLARCYVTPGIAAECGVYRVDSIDGSQLIGRNHADCAGLVFPYRRPGSTQVLLHRLRLDHPPIDAATG